MSKQDIDMQSCGLDFGTSNSTLGIVNADGEPILVPLEGDEAPIPSVIFFSFEDDQTYFGQQALSEYKSGAEGRMMRSLKSVLGTSLMREETRIKGNRLAFTKVLEIFLQQMRVRAEAHLGNRPHSERFRQVVAGRPVHFVDDNESADRDAQNQLEAAIKATGFAHVEFQYEPIAAALDYERTIQNEQLAMVVDIGGGTSDFTIIRLSPERARAIDRKQDILATGGVHVGGTDFDRLFSMAKIMPLLGLGSKVKIGNRDLPIGPYFDLASWHRINRLYTNTAMKNLRSTRQEAMAFQKIDSLIEIVRGRYGHALAGQVEVSKIALSHRDTDLFAFNRPEVVLEQALTRRELDLAIKEAVMRIPATINGVLGAAELKSDDIQTLIMTGGSTQIPILRAQLNALFRGAEFVQTDAFGSVGLGLALDASRRF